MKIKPSHGQDAQPPLRVSNGIYVRRLSDGAYIYAKKPDQPYNNTDQGQCARDMFAYSAWLASTAIPLEVQSARNWQVNSNDTWKDALTRAQWGTLFRIELDDGTVSYPIDHACAGPPEIPLAMAAYQLFQTTTFVTGVGQSVVDWQLPTGVDDAMVIMWKVGASAAGTRLMRLSVDGGATFSATDYQLIDSSGVVTTVGGATNVALANTTQMTMIWWWPTLALTNNLKIWYPMFTDARKGIWTGSINPVTHLRVLNSVGNLTGTTGVSFIAFLGKQSN